MTVSVTTRSASRAGNGPPSGRESGSASATASETTPRMPAQDKTSECANRCGVRALAAQERRHIGGGEDPQRPDSDQDTGHRDADADELDRGRGRERAQELRHLEPGEDEDEPIEEKRDRSPTRHARQPDVGAHDARATTAEVQAGDHRRDHAGGAELLGREEGGVRREEGDRDLHRRVLDARPDLCDHPPHRQADRPPAQRPRWRRS